MEAQYLSDWSGTVYGVPLDLERPRSTAALANWLGERNRSRIPVAIQGGRTGVSGGAAPGDGEHILSLDRMNDVVDFDRGAGVIVVQAGMVLAQLQQIVERDGWSFPLDLGSRGSCQLGGNAATNAGGSRVIKYGNTRNLVLGLEAVLADGTVIGPANRLVKNNAGYNLGQLLVGSEGTLGVITELALKLVPLVAERGTALIALADDAKLETVLARCMKALGSRLSAFEVMWPEFVRASIAVRPQGRALPDSFLNCRVALIEIEADGGESAVSLIEAGLAQLYDDGAVSDILVAGSGKDAADLWAVRESIGEIQATIRPYTGFDLGIPIRDHDEFKHRATEALRASGLSVTSMFFGHAGDGNLHALIGPCKSAEQRAQVDACLHDLLPPYSTVTAEHGVGRKRKAVLPLSRSAADIAAMKAIKKALDPNGILNAGRIFDL